VFGRRRSSRLVGWLVGGRSIITCTCFAWWQRQPVAMPSYDAACRDTHLRVTVVFWCRDLIVGVLAPSRLVGVRDGDHAVLAQWIFYCSYKLCRPWLVLEWVTTRITLSAMNLCPSAGVDLKLRSVVFNIWTTGTSNAITAIRPCH